MNRPHGNTTLHVKSECRIESDKSTNQCGKNFRVMWFFLFSKISCYEYFNAVHPRGGADACDANLTQLLSGVAAALSWNKMKSMFFVAIAMCTGFISAQGNGRGVKVRLHSASSTLEYYFFQTFSTTRADQVQNCLRGGLKDTLGLSTQNF